MPAPKGRSSRPFVYDDDFLPGEAGEIRTIELAITEVRGADSEQDRIRLLSYNPENQVDGIYFTRF